MDGGDRLHVWCHVSFRLLQSGEIGGIECADTEP